MSTHCLSLNHSRYRRDSVRQRNLLLGSSKRQCKLVVLVGLSRENIEVLHIANKNPLVSRIVACCKLCVSSLVQAVELSKSATDEKGDVDVEKFI